MRQKGHFTCMFVAHFPQLRSIKTMQFYLQIAGLLKLCSAPPETRRDYRLENQKAIPSQIWYGSLNKGRGVTHDAKNIRQIAWLILAYFQKGTGTTEFVICGVAFEVQKQHFSGWRWRKVSLSNQKISYDKRSPINDLFLCRGLNRRPSIFELCALPTGLNMNGHHDHQRWPGCDMIGSRWGINDAFVTAHKTNNTTRQSENILQEM